GGTEGSPGRHPASAPAGDGGGVPSPSGRGGNGARERRELTAGAGNQADGQRLPETPPGSRQRHPRGPGAAGPDAAPPCATTAGGAAPATSLTLGGRPRPRAGGGGPFRPNSPSPASPYGCNCAEAGS